MPAPIETFESHEHLVARVNELMSGKDGKGHGETVFILFVGNRIPDSNESWCPDCVKAEPIVEDAWRMATGPAALTRIHFIKCFVGARDCWKDPNNQYKREPRFRLQSIPTLIEFKGEWREVNRLERYEDFTSVDSLKTLFAETFKSIAV